MIKLVDKDGKTVFINMFHMLKERKHGHDEERIGKIKTFLSPISKEEQQYGYCVFEVC